MAGIKTKCLTCGKEFISLYVSKVQKRCSRECYYKSIRGVKLKTEHVEKIRSSVTGYRHTEESRKKISNSQLGKKRPQTSGEKSCKWKGGVSSSNEIARKSIEYKQWRTSVFERDSYTCVVCRNIGGKLHPHHLFNFSIYIDLRFNIHNGVTMCECCHKKFHKEYGNIKNNPQQFFEFFRRWMSMLPCID